MGIAVPSVLLHERAAGTWGGTSWCVAWRSPGRSAVQARAAAPDYQARGTGGSRGIRTVGGSPSIPASTGRMY
jgi:hypothetical protein